MTTNPTTTTADTTPATTTDTITAIPPAIVPAVDPAVEREQYLLQLVAKVEAGLDFKTASKAYRKFCRDHPLHRRPAR
jgi:hypothetical protein